MGDILGWTVIDTDGIEPLFGSIHVLQGVFLHRDVLGPLQCKRVTALVVFYLTSLVRIYYFVLKS